MYIEDTNEFKKKVKEGLKAIGSGKAKRLSEDSISFQSLDQLRKFLTPKRLELLRAVKHQKPKSMYELAKLTTPNVGEMTMKETNLPLTVDMTLKSAKIKPFKIGA